jgi:prepilin-type N-terminal cleavage/methylation domain-containing protein
MESSLPKRSSDQGFTLTEILIVVAIIIILLAVFLTNWFRQLQRGFDGQRKTDLAKIGRALEEYYNDHGCYPPVSPTFDNCGRPNGTGLQPYLEFIPCDPETKQPYAYEPVNGDPCQGHRTFANLSDTSDPDISRLGCTSGCAGTIGINYNYGISSGVPVGYGSGVTPSPDPTAVWACVNWNPPVPGAQCNNVGSQSCTVTKYTDEVTCEANCTVIGDVGTCTP